MEFCEKLIDVKKIIKNGKSNFLKKLPDFVINWLKKIIREDQLNYYYSIYKDFAGMEFVNAYLFNELNIKVKIEGEKNVKKDKKYVYVANHPLGAIDSLSFLYLINKIHGKVISPSNELFEYIPNLHPLIVGINVFGKNTKEKIKNVNKAFETDSQIMIFPSGEVSRKIKGKIQDPFWHKTFITKAVQFKRDIVPVYISGKNSRKFYFIAKTRKLLGFKTYLETILLPQEMIKQKNKNIRLKIGNPISYKEIKQSNISHSDWAEKTKKYLYSLKN